MEILLQQEKMVKITLPDGIERKYEDKVTVKDVACDIAEKNRGMAIAGKVNSTLIDLDSQIEADTTLDLVMADSEDGLEILRHSTAHVMAQAVANLYPNAKLGIGPSIKDGFYYDFDLETTLAEEDLEKIEAEMKRIIESDETFDRFEEASDAAIKRMAESGQDYKVELIKGLEDQTISFYRQGDFVDLCRGPHLASTKKITAFKLLSVAGAYWRGKETNPMLQRIYGTAFTNKKDLRVHLKLLEEAGVDMIWMPTPEAIYPQDYQTWITVEHVSRPLEGKMRPGHFKGVTTIVAKLFNAVQPQRAYFGQKDAQQVAVIQRMVYDLNFPIKIVVGPIARADDGLALSSRNAYLNDAERQAALVLHKALKSAKALIDGGERDADQVRNNMVAVLDREPLALKQYVSCADPNSLVELDLIKNHALLSLAVHIGNTRLIDNFLMQDNKWLAGN